MTQLTNSEVLNLAADEIERRGWTQAGESDDPWGFEGGPVCAEGGLCTALGWRANLYGAAPETGLTRQPAVRAFGEYLGTERRIFYWNDATGRTQEQVIEALRACALIEKAKEDNSVSAKEYQTA